MAEPFGEDVGHELRGEGDGEGELGVVLRHGGYVDVLWIWEVGFGRTVEVSEELRDFADAVGAVVEEEEGVVICLAVRDLMVRNRHDLAVGFRTHL